jgi:hypothetical protein
MLPSPQISLEHLKKIADFEPSVLKNIEKGLLDTRTDKELTASKVPSCSPTFCSFHDFELFTLFAGRLLGTV